MNILITGATGYIGSNLVRKLLNLNHDISIVNQVNTRIPFKNIWGNKLSIYIYDGTISSLEVPFNQNEYDVVIHIASLVIREHQKNDIDGLVTSNILFGTQLLEVMRNFGARNFINTGTYWQHYKNEFYNPVNLYAATKKAFEDILKYYFEAYQMNILTLELFDNYGPLDNRKKLLSLLRDAIRRDENIAVTQGEQELVFVHIDDVVNAYITAIKLILEIEINPQFNIYAVRDKMRIKLNDLFKMVESLSDKKLKVDIGGREYAVREVMQAYEIIPILPNWEPKIPLATGLKEYLNEKE